MDKNCLRLKKNDPSQGTQHALTRYPSHPTPHPKKEKKLATSICMSELSRKAWHAHKIFTKSIFEDGTETFMQVSAGCKPLLDKILQILVEGLIDTLLGLFHEHKDIILIDGIYTSQHNPTSISYYFCCIKIAEKPVI